MNKLHDNVIICGYGRAGQLIGQLLSEKLIPFEALDVANERVAAGKVGCVCGICQYVCVYMCLHER